MGRESARFVDRRDVFNGTPRRRNGGSGRESGLGGRTPRPQVSSDRGRRETYRARTEGAFERGLRRAPPGPALVVSLPEGSSGVTRQLP